MQYRREIDGLRAVAVLPVILFHAGFSMFSGGFVGVDVFFVISGYLITSIIVNELQTGHFSLARFYERRARRILPALTLVILCCLPFAWLWLSPDALRDFAESVLTVVIFSSNFLFWSEAGYFNTEAELKPLLHTWSLAVEEQYYLLFPLLVTVLWSRGRKVLMAALCVLTVASFIYAEWAVENAPAAAFYLLPFRAWELLIGAMAALYLAGKSELPVRQSWLRAVLAGTGLVLILAAVLMLDDDTPFPGIYALPPTLGTVLIILFASQSDVIGKLLGKRALVGIGLVSYSAYLWHQPLFAFARVADAVEPSVFDMWLLIAATFVLAWASWRYVEAPFRRRNLFSRKKIVTYSIAAGIFLIAVAAPMAIHKGFPSRLAPEDQIIYKVSQERNPKRGRCNSFNLADGLPLHDCVPAGDFQARAILLGDSHANAFAPWLEERLAEENIGLSVFTRGGCVPVQGLSRNGNADECTRQMDMVTDYMLSAGSETIVVLMARWTLSYEGTRFDNQEGGVEHGEDGEVYPLDVKIVNEQHRRQMVAEQYQQQVRDLLDAGKSVVLVYSLPEAGWNVPKRMIQKRNTNYRTSFASTRYDVFKSRHQETFAVLDAIGEHPRLRRVRFDAQLCDTLIEKRCITQIDGMPLYKDDDHVSRAGAAWLGETLVDAVKELAEQHPR